MTVTVFGYLILISMLGFHDFISLFSPGSDCSKAG